LEKIIADLELAQNLNVAKGKNKHTKHIFGFMRGKRILYKKGFRIEILKAFAE
jgi:hypothetical protein